MLKSWKENCRKPSCQTFPIHQRHPAFLTSPTTQQFCRQRPSSSWDFLDDNLKMQRKCTAASGRLLFLDKSIPFLRAKSVPGQIFWTAKSSSRWGQGSDSGGRCFQMKMPKKMSRVIECLLDLVNSSDPNTVLLVYNISKNSWVMPTGLLPAAGMPAIHSTTIYIHINPPPKRDYASVCNHIMPSS